MGPVEMTSVRCVWTDRRFEWSRSAVADCGGTRHNRSQSSASCRRTSRTRNRRSESCRRGRRSRPTPRRLAATEGKRGIGICRSKVSGMALATGECGLRFPAQHRRLAPCRSVFRPLLGAFLKPPAMQVVAEVVFSVGAYRPQVEKIWSSLSPTDASFFGRSRSSVRPFAM